MKLLASGSLSAGNLVANLDSGQFRRFVFTFTGSALASQTVAASDFGTIQLSKKNQQIVNVSFADLQTINNLKGGAVYSKSTTGGSFTFVGMLDFALPGDNLNVLSIEKPDGAVLEINFDVSSITNNVSNGIVQVYGVEAEGIQAYVLNLHKFDMVVSQGDIPFTLPANNIVEWFVENDANLTKLSVDKDGEQVVDANKETLLGLTHYQNRIETFDENLSFLDIDLLPTGQLESSLADSIKAVVTAGASATINSYIWHLTYDLNDYERSSVKMESKIAQKFVGTRETNSSAKSVIGQLKQLPKNSSIPVA